MLVYIMRHGQAEMMAKTDALRPLTQQGHDESVKMARWLAPQVSELDHILCSPYLRAQQTLNAIQPHLPQASSLEELAFLTPSGNTTAVANHLFQLAEQGMKQVLIVSHLPLVGYLVGELCPDEGSPIFATSGIACIELDDDLQGQLHFLHAPHSLFQF
ncbi:phosphohistidine phosphatase SixA [Motilimonas cestriensis]|uniref:Phosphohistidine phosphatase SixA n=1 Tax=Motilimonas cestriensis TaxID=2742685 RepID=A0ABS8W9L3_9GAMM|nr:phosphohistidine phosphatase SixA [Motilimonas cestriensis]MCE2595702.1 phosphohistidine phosphatase SixA [Motilimonas cestriensis]